MSNMPFATQEEAAKFFEKEKFAHDLLADLTENHGLHEGDARSVVERIDKAQTIDEIDGVIRDLQATKVEALRQSSEAASRALMQGDFVGSLIGRPTK